MYVGDAEEPEHVWTVSDDPVPYKWRPDGDVALRFVYTPGLADADGWTASNFAGLKSLTTRGIGGGNYVNGTSVGQLELTPGKVASLYVGKDVVATGANTLTLTCVSGETLKLDAVTLNGSWQNGLDVTSQGINLFGRQNDVFDSYDLTPACGDDKVHIRGTDGPMHPYIYSFRIPEDLVGTVKGKLHFRVQNTSQTLYPFETSVNGTVLSTNQMKNGSACTISVPSRLLKAGWNKAQFKALSGWGNMDCHQFVIQPHVDGTLILIR